MNTPLLKEASNLWKHIPTGEATRHQDLEKELSKYLNTVFHVGDFYYLIFHLQELEFNLVSKEVMAVLGYTPQEFDLALFFEKLHPEDYTFFLKFEDKVIHFFTNLPFEQIPHYKVRYDFRIKKKDGKYVRILSQYIVLDYNDEGQFLRTFVVQTDITHLKAQGIPMLSFIGLNGLPSFINVDTEQQQLKPACLLTPREREILSLLSDGKGSKEIAAELFISLETVHSHRKNILAKMGASNTAQLIKKATREGWI